MCGIAQHNPAHPMGLIGPVQPVPAMCPTRQQLGPIYPNQSQLVPTSWALRMTKSPMPQLVFSQKSKLTTTNQDVAGAPQKILGLKTSVLGMCHTNSPSTQFWTKHNMFQWNCACHFGQIACHSMHAPNHPDDRACQLVTQDDTEMLLFTMVLKRVCGVNLDQGIDWPVNPQIKLTTTKWQATSDNTPK